MSINESLAYLAEQLNNYIYKPEHDEDTAQLKRDIAQQYADEVRDSFMKQFVLPRPVEQPFLRVSQLGKPAVLQALSLLGYTKDGDHTTKLRHIFHTGDVFESYVVAYMRFMDWSVQRQQEELEFLGVKGHIDGVLNIPGCGSTLLEFKTMSQNYFSAFTKAPNDDRGYITQLAIYSAVLELPAVWCVINKGTHEVRLIEPEQEDLDAALARAVRIIPKLKQVKTLEDVVTLFKAPPAEEELYRGKATGEYKVPESMRYSPFRYAFYDIRAGKSKGGAYREYVVGERSREQALEKLQGITASYDDEVKAILEAEEVA